MNTTRVDRLFAAALLLLGLFIVWRALEYGYMRGNTPGAGFFPLWVGLGLTALSAVNLARSLRGAEVLRTTFDRRGLASTAGIVAAIAAFIVLSPLVGMLAGSALLIPALAFAIRPRWTPRFAATIVTIALVFPVVCYYLFSVYLRVPLQMGPLGY